MSTVHTPPAAIDRHRLGPRQDTPRLLLYNPYLVRVHVYRSGKCDGVARSRFGAICVDCARSGWVCPLLSQAHGLDLLARHSDALQCETETTPGDLSSFELTLPSR